MKRGSARSVGREKKVQERKGKERKGKEKDVTWIEQGEGVMVGIW